MGMDEKVLCVPRSEFDALGYFEGFSHDDYTPLLTCSARVYKPRGEVESDPLFKQLIPYITFRCKDSVFTYQRTKMVGEQRLSKKRSLAFGGHVNTSWEQCLRREIEEELFYPNYDHLQYRYIGAVNDSTDVGIVHLGICYVVDLVILQTQHLLLKDEALVDGRWMSPEELVQQREAFEGWSQILIDNKVWEL